LVTGGTGFIGRHVVTRLLDRGAKLRLFCRDAAKARRLFGERVEVVIGDLAQLPADVCRGCASVVHVAGGYAFGRRHAAQMVAANVTGTRALLEAAWQARVEKFVHISSSGMLTNDRQPITERDFPTAVGERLPYRRTKWLGEQAALEYAARGLPVMVASPTSPLGPGDEVPTPTGQVVRDFLAGKFPFAGPPMLNFVDVGELADGIIAVGERGRSGERYILGGHSLWHAEFLRLLGRITGLPAPRFTLPVWAVTLGGAVGELIGSERLCWETAVHCRKRQPFDLSKACVELGWEARVPLEVSARAAVHWFRQGKDTS
jgi:dihydroflavonol-4-reductase